jgi:AmmeMemoRadiSam system protein B
VNPKIRSLEVIPFQDRGQEFLLLRDRLGLAVDVQVPRALAPLLALFDGTRDATAIAGAYALRGGELLPPAFLQRLIEQLDEQLLLHSPRFEAHQRAVVGAFEQTPERPAAFAGLSYPAEPEALRALLDGFWQEAAALECEPEYSPSRLRGIIVPHIDFTRGGAVEALAYRHLARAQFDTLVVLGIAHSGVRYPFCALAKDFATPLGAARGDCDFIAALQARLGPRLLAEQFAHKSEHSVEFVAVFGQYAPALREALLAPIICGGFFDEIRNGISPQSTPAIAQFIAALREVTAEWQAQGKRVGFVVSVDLTHAGSRFGDDRVLHDADLRAIEAADRELLQNVVEGNAEGWHRHIARDDNARNVDAHPAVYALLAAFPSWRGQLLRYAQTFDAPANALVSFASLALYDGV